MSKSINLTVDQLDFISFMRGSACINSTMRNRIESCIDKLSTTDDENPKELHHSPHKMIKFLSLFSRDNYFKWYTHKWDQGEVTLENMIDEQPRKKAELSKWVYHTISPVNERTYNQIWNFINFDIENNFYWTDNNGHRCNIGWHSIVELHKITPNLPVENLKLQDGNLFKDIIRSFKSSIEFRTDLRTEDRFSKVVRNTLKRTINGAVELEFSQSFKKIGADINIYCDIPALVFGLGIICDWIVKHKAIGNSVTIDLTSDPEFYELLILHHDSYFSNEEKLIRPSGDFDKLRKQLFSVCDLTLVGDLKKDGEKNGTIVVYGLNDDTKMSNRHLSPCSVDYSDKPIGGVMYKLKLYKS